MHNQGHKLGTPELKLLISTWLDTPTLKEEIRNYYVRDDSSQDQIDRYASYFQLPKGLTAEQVREHIWNLWRDGQHWKRETKERLGVEWESFFYRDSEPEMMEDFCGGQDKPLVKKLFDGKELERCWHRTFVPDNDLADNFRLEVVTTPDDTEVVGWTVIVD